MKSGILQKICAAAASLMLICTGLPFPVHTASAAVYDAEPAVMYVMLKGGTLTELAEENLTDAQKVRLVQQRGQMQNAVFEKICALYPEAEMRYQYTLLMNGFSCVIPETLADAVRALPGVADVAKCSEMQVSPYMAEAAALGSIPDFYQETGCTGEGQVICVIDTELDVTHPMFAPLSDDINVKLTKEDVRNIAETVGFHVNADPDRLYISSKVPFAADYVSDDPYAVSNPEDNIYHGTHVSGIAAGNAVQGDRGQMISGVARDAQLVFMAMEQYLVPDESLYEYAEDSLRKTTVLLTDTAVAMFEDAVKLRADVINMSFGIDWILADDDHILTEAVNAASEAGVTVCISAGNEGGNTTGGRPEIADRSSMNTLISEGSRALAVASADNEAMLRIGLLRLGDRKISCTGYFSSDYQNEPDFLNDVLPEGYYDYVYCGAGDETDFEGVDLKGKIALTERGNYFIDLLARAEAAGAAGLIVRSYDDDLSIYPMGLERLPITIVSASDGEALLNASDKRIYIAPEYDYIKTKTKVSSYTSWGMLPSLELRPDIMGIGGNVTSAAYDGAFTSLSGTSMSSPYLAGCTALLNEYLERSGCGLTGEAKQQRIRNLLMTGAVPYRTDGVYDSPRQQGAGLVSLENAIRTNVIMTGPEGESKLSLHDKLGSTFSFPVTVTNFGDEDVTFSSAKLELCTDRAETDGGQAHLSGMQALSCTADCTALTTVAGGESKTVSITVQLDSAETTALGTVFPNGFYIDGYLLLEGAENNPDISIPLSGFSGDYCDITIAEYYCGAATRGLIAMLSGYSMMELSEIAKEIMQPLLTEQQMEYLDLRYGNSGDSEDELAAQQKLNSGIYDEAMYELSEIEDCVRNRLEEMEYEYDGRMIYVSPDDDLVADQPAFGFISPYTVNVDGLRIRDAAGNLVAVPQYTRCLVPERFISSLTCGDELTNLAEGTYSAEVTFTRASDGSSGSVSQDYAVPFTVDRTPPDVETSVSEQNGRKILTLTANDPILDGFVILGKGTGGIAGKYNPANPPAYTMTALHYFLTGTRHAALPLSVDLEEAGVIREEYHWTNGKPLNRLMLDEESSMRWLDQFDFSDCVKAEPDENGTYTLFYDITDFTAYDINVIDCACNITEVSQNVSDPARPEPKENPLKLGVYRSSEMVIEVGTDTIRVVPYCDKQLAETYPYTFEYQYLYYDDYYGHDGYFLYFTAPDGREEKFRLSEYENGDIGMRGDYSIFIRAGLCPHDQRFIRTDLPDADSFIAFGYEEAKGAFVSPFMRQFTIGRTPDRIETNVGLDQNGHAVARFVYTYGSPAADFIGFKVYSVTVDLTDGTAELPDETVQRVVLNQQRKGDVNLSGVTDVADVVLLARFLAEDAEAIISAQGLRNADCNANGSPDSNDVTLIMRIIAKLIAPE